MPKGGAILEVSGVMTGNRYLLLIQNVHYMGVEGGEMWEKMTIDRVKLKEVCKIGQGAKCCRYIVVCGRDGITCAKNIDMKKALDRRVEAGQFTAIADNCEGE